MIEVVIFSSPHLPTRFHKNQHQRQKLYPLNVTNAITSSEFYHCYKLHYQHVTNFYTNPVIQISPHLSSECHRHNRQRRRMHDLEATNSVINPVPQMSPHLSSGCHELYHQRHEFYHLDIPTPTLYMCPNLFFSPTTSGVRSCLFESKTCCLHIIMLETSRYMIV